MILSFQEINDRHQLGYLVSPLVIIKSLKKKNHHRMMQKKKKKKIDQSSWKGK